VGCFQSSSLNSDILLAVACRIQPGRISSFSLAFAGNIEVERSARQIAAHCGAYHHQLSLEADEAIAWVKEGLVTLDQPTPDVLHTFLLSRSMRDQGFTVALSSLGANELFGGCQSHRLVSWLLRIGWLPTHIRHQLLNWLSPALACKLSRLPYWDTWHLSLALRRLQGDSQLAAAGAVPLQWPQQPPQRITQGFGQITWAELFGAIESMLLRDSNTLSKAAGLEPRFPFLDHQLVEAALRMPQRFQHSGNSLLRQACADLFPPGYLECPKQGFALPMATWMRGPLRDLCRSRLEVLQDSGWLDPAWIDLQWQAFESGKLEWPQAWGLVVLGNHLIRSENSV
jgi:asparagine synthase (glutamine-hydrolysing)